MLLLRCNIVVHAEAFLFRKATKDRVIREALHLSGGLIHFYNGIETSISRVHERLGSVNRPLTEDAD